MSITTKINYFIDLYNEKFYPEKVNLNQLIPKEVLGNIILKNVMDKDNCSTIRTVCKYWHTVTELLSTPFQIIFTRLRMESLSSILRSANTFRILGQYSNKVQLPLQLIAVAQDKYEKLNEELDRLKKRNV
jgi:hypothetical protein